MSEISKEIEEIGQSVCSIDWLMGTIDSDWIGRKIVEMYPWIAINGDGTVCLYDSEPKHLDWVDYWTSDTGDGLYIGDVDLRGTDWQDTKKRLK